MNFIIVLGNSSFEVRYKRVEKAVKYFLSLKPDVDQDTFSVNPVAKLIFSGGGNNSRREPGIDSAINNSSEGESMKKIASKLGVDDNDCIIENRSRNTRENFTETIKLLKFLGWFDPTICHQKHTFTICTSSFHAKRALVIGLEILLPYGEVYIIHTNEEISSEIEKRENTLLGNYINDIICPSHLKNNY